MNSLQLKIYGERNTGTRYLEKLIAANVDTRLLPGVAPRTVARLQRWLPGTQWLRDLYFRLSFCNNLGWKHALIMPVTYLNRCRQDAELPGIITLTKNPYSWVLSLYRRPYHYRGKRVPFEDFLTQPWHTTGREAYPGAFSSPIDMWNRKNAAYLQIPDNFTVINLRYEDLVDDPEATINRVSKKFALPRHTPAFAPVLESTKHDGRHYADYQRYYADERWRQELTDTAIARINERLDLHLLKQFGYDKL